MYCAKCGAVVRDDEIYCKKCKRDVPPKPFTEFPGDPPPVPPIPGMPAPAAQKQAPVPAAPDSPTAEVVLMNLTNQLPALKKGIAINALVFLGGLALLILTVSYIQATAHTYFAFVAMMLYGGGRLIRCLADYVKFKGKIESLRRQTGA